MNDVTGQVPSAGDGDSLGSPPRGGASRPGCLRTVGTVGLILAGLGVAVVIWLWISLQQAFPTPQAVSAPVAWTSQQVVLSDDRSFVHGRLTLTARATPGADLRVGVNAGAPSTDVTARPSGAGDTTSSATLAPAVLLSGPLVQLTVADASGAPQSCFAPCELQLPSSFECESGTCGTGFNVTVALITGRVGIGGSVTLDVAGGATAPLDERLPDGLVVDLEVESAIEPRGS